MSLSTTIPALPAQNIPTAVTFYCERLGFSSPYSDDGFARLVRDVAEIHLWAADDHSWKGRADLAKTPISSGAESYLAGTASCRIEVDAVDELHAEMKLKVVLHPTSQGAPADTDWHTREFAALDLDGNLLTFFQLT